MPSQAISAQGSTLEIGTGSGGAKNISAGAAGFPTILTSNAHGFSNGDRVTLAAFTGADAATLNAIVATVENVTTNTFSVAINTLAKTITYTTGTATPVTYTEIEEVKSFSGFDGAASEIDVTTLKSTAMEFRLGLQDFGSFKVEINVLNADPGQAACAAAKASGEVKNFRLTLPNAEVASFSGLVKSMPAQGGVNGIFGGSMDIRITGEVTWA